MTPRADMAALDPLAVEEGVDEVPGIAPDLTIVVPTYNERDNVVPLVRGIEQACAGRVVELLFVDDSDDDTPEVIAQVACASSLDIRLLHRSRQERTGGLSGAVTAGLRAATARFVVVMDGDLQHPPSLVPVLQDAMREGADVLVASRYCGEGDPGGLDGRWRREVSQGSTMLARGLFPHRVGRRCTDPLTGFFCVDRSALDLDQLRPRGFKILLELLARQELRVQEVPFVFGVRLTGESKATWRQGAHFLNQLVQLRLDVPVVRFALVGAVGFLVNLAVMAALLWAGTGYVLAAVLASELTILGNFLLQERFVFRVGTARRSRLHRAVHSVGLNNLEMLGRIPVLALLVSHLGWNPLAAAALALGVAFFARFFFLSRVTYRQDPQPVIRVRDGSVRSFGGEA